MEIIDTIVSRQQHNSEVGINFVFKIKKQADRPFEQSGIFA
jgi:hypothetical protein